MEYRGKCAKTWNRLANQNKHGRQDVFASAYHVVGSYPRLHAQGMYINGYEMETPTSGVIITVCYR